MDHRFAAADGILIAPKPTPVQNDSMPSPYESQDGDQRESCPIWGRLFKSTHDVKSHFQSCNFVNGSPQGIEWSNTRGAWNTGGQDMFQSPK